VGVTPAEIKRTLQKAQLAGTLVAIERIDLADGLITGFVAGCGPEWFALDVVDQSVRIDGVTCLAYADVSLCEAPAPGADFTVKALRVLGVERPTQLDVDLTSLESLLRTAGALYPVMTISAEGSEPDSCWVGRLDSVSRHLATLQLINPDAQWEKEPEEFGLDEITRIDFGTEYERALVLVGGAGGFRYN
jgi:hypothetical protein